MALDAAPCPGQETPNSLHPSQYQGRQMGDCVEGLPSEESCGGTGSAPQEPWDPATPCPRCLRPVLEEIP